MERERTQGEYDEEAKEILERVFSEEPGENEPENPVEARQGLPKEPRRQHDEEGRPTERKSHDLPGIARYFTESMPEEPTPQQLRETAVPLPSMLYDRLLQRIGEDFILPEIDELQSPRLHVPGRKGAAYLRLYPKDNEIHLVMKGVGREEEKTIIFRPDETVIAVKKGAGEDAKEELSQATPKERAELEAIIEGLEIAAKKRLG